MPSTATKTEYLAKFRLPISGSEVATIDGFKVIRNCKLLESGGTARVSLQDGTILKVERTAELSENLRDLADLQGGVVDAHFTHDWVEDSKDPLHYDVGFWSDLWVDDTGSLLGTLNLSPSQYADKILFIARKNPRAGMVSAIFKFHAYERDGKTYAEPFEFRSADIVRKGEATTALLSAVKQTQTNKIMPLTKEDISELVKAPEFTASLSSIVKDAVKDAMPAPVDATAVLKQAQPEIEKAVKAGIESATPEITKAAEAAAIAKIGDARLSKKDGGGDGGNEGATAFLSKVKEYTQGGKVNEAVAEMRVASDFPELYEAHRAGIFSPRIA